jgi:hypothetical protein
VLQLTFPLLDYFPTLTNNRTNEMVPIMGIPKDMIHMVMLGPLKIISCLPYPGYEITSSNHRSSPRHNRLTCFSLYRTSVRSELSIQIKFTDRSDEVGSGFFYQMHHAMEFEVIWCTRNRDLKYIVTRPYCFSIEIFILRFNLSHGATALHFLYCSLDSVSVEVLQ